MKIATAGFTCVDNYANLDNRHYPAGNGFDALVNLAKMGVECAVVSAVGPDKYGEEMFEVLKKYGVDSSHLHVLPGETSFMIMEMTENNDRVHVKNIPGVMDDFELTRDDVEFLKGYDYVHTEFFWCCISIWPSCRRPDAKSSLTCRLLMKDTLKPKPCFEISTTLSCLTRSGMSMSKS